MQTMGPSYQARMKDKQEKQKTPNKSALFEEGKRPTGASLVRLSKPSTVRRSEAPAPAETKPAPKQKSTPAAGKYDGMSFGAAFNAARKDGESTFPWRGKQYTTQTKEEADAKKKAAAPVKATTSAAPAAPAAKPAPKQVPTLKDKPSGKITPAKFEKNPERKSKRWDIKRNKWIEM